MYGRDNVIAPKFTVIIPAYNAGKFIHVAIDSVQKQTLQDWELIIVENGSTDDTTAVCEEFLHDKRIILLHSEKGVSRARNTGIRIAKGKWIVFLDADDQLLNDAFHKYSEIDEKYSPDIIIGEYEDNMVDYTYEKRIYQGRNLKKFLRISLENPTQKCNTKAVAFKSSVIQQGVFFDPDIRYAEDSVFFLEALFCSSKVVTVSSPVYRVIYYSQSAVRSGKQKLDMEYIPAINRVGTILDISDPMIKNEWYLFTLNQLLVILVNDVFYRQKPVLEQIKDAKKLMGIFEYKRAITDADISNVHGMKKVVFRMMKMKFVTGMLLAVRVRQKQNKKKENTFDV